MVGGDSVRFRGAEGIIIGFSACFSLHLHSGHLEIIRTFAKANNLRKWLIFGFVLQFSTIFAIPDIIAAKIQSR